jgi:hypothetical protein
MRVLAITDDGGPLAELRVQTPLRQLRQQKLIDDYAVCNSELEGAAGGEFEFDTVLLQRVASIGLLIALEEAGIPYCLDMDDNLLLAASFRKGGDPEVGIDRALCGCRTLSCTSRRLVGLFEKHIGIRLMDKARLTPNSIEFPERVRAAQRPEQLLWVQGDAVALTYSAERIRAAVGDFANRHNLDICLIGKSMVAERSLARARPKPSISHQELIDYLHSGPASIGIAPLETVGEEETLDFITSKSDVKKLLFGGLGHTGVFSAAYPYVESDLETGALAQNTYEGWMEALEACWEQGWKRSESEAERIRELRSASRVARECWYPALSGARGPGMVTLSRLRQHLVKAMKEPASEAGTAPGNGVKLMPNTGGDQSPLRTEWRIRTLERRVRTLTQAVDGIYLSATWRTLITLGGIVQRLMPKRRF